MCSYLMDSIWLLLLVRASVCFTCVFYGDLDVDVKYATATNGA